MDDITLEQIIRTHINLPARPNSQGWFPVLCKACNDHGRKGPRAAFKFEGQSVGYHCFNCQRSHKFDPVAHRSISKNMEEVLLAFDVPAIELDKLRLSLFGKRREEEGEQPQKLINREPEELELPSHFYSIKRPSDFCTTSQAQWIQVVQLYLEERCIDASTYNFMLSTGVPEDLDIFPKELHTRIIKQAQKWVGRVIVPIYKDGKLIFYVGRDMTDKKLKKYESPSNTRQNVLFGFDGILKDTSRPLYIVEGVFDAFVIDGVAILGNELSEGQIYWLNRSNRQKVYIPDRFGDGHITANKAVDLGWSVSFPDIGDEKDVNAAVQKYGKLYVHTNITENTLSGFEARARIGLYCK